MISYVNKLGTVSVGGSNPVRIMGILNTSPESFYKKSVSISREKIVDVVKKMEGDDPTALIGLPLIRLCEMLKKQGIDIP